MNLKMAFHSITGRRMVEVRDNSGRMVACIYPDEDSNGIKVISKYVDRIVEGQKDADGIRDVFVTFARRQS